MASNLQQGATSKQNIPKSPTILPLDPLESVLAALWEDWVFRLSLSSNELFHSNILQYLVEELSDTTAGNRGAGKASEGALADVSPPIVQGGVMPQTISWGAMTKLFFVLSGFGETELLEALPDLAKPQAQHRLFWIRREWQSMDLVVGIDEPIKGSKKGAISAKPLFALEVKVKAYPTSEQLLEYHEKLSKAWKSGRKKFSTFHPPLFLLTGMGMDRLAEAPAPTPTETTSNTRRGQVRHLNFNDVGQRLGELFTRHDPPHMVGNAYVGLCQKIHSLFESLKSLLEDTLTAGETEKISRVLAPYRLHSLWWKLWGAHIAKELEKAVPQTAEIKKYFIVEHGFSHTGNFNAYWRLKTGKKKKEESIGIGVQLEGRSLRLFLNLSHPSMSSRWNGLDARGQAENLLMALCNLGIFARNPGMKLYRAHWGKETDQFINQERLHLLLQMNTPPQAGPFEDEVGVGRFIEGTGKRFCLPGYENSQCFGHADFRLLLNQDVQISVLVELIRDILIHGKYSDMPSQAPPLHPEFNPLLELVKGFEAAGEARQAWIRDPELGV